jgi:hypothetical protein
MAEEYNENLKSTYEHLQWQIIELKEKLKVAVELIEQVKDCRRIGVYMMDGKTIGTLGESALEVLEKIKAK